MPFLGGVILKEVTVFYRTKATVADDTEETEQSVSGLLWQEDDRWVLRYVEEDGSQTTWVLGKKEAHLIRRGELAYHQTFSLQNPHHFVLKTAVGSITMKTKTKVYRLQMTPNQLHFDLCYSMYDINDRIVGYYEMGVLTKY